MAQEAAVPLSTVKELARQIAREEIARYARSGPLRNASAGPLRITERGVRMHYPDELGGGEAVFFGPIVSAIDGDYLGTGLLLQQPDGTDLAQFRTDEETGNSVAALHDSDGTAVISLDTVGGKGLSRPLLDHPFHRHRWSDLTVTAATTEFETLWAARFFKLHMRLHVGVRSGMDTAGTFGQLRVLVNGEQLGDVVTRPFANDVTLITGVPPGAIGDWLVVEIQGRRNGASGALRVEPAYCLGVPSDATA